MSSEEAVELIVRLLPPWLSAVQAVNEVIAREAGVGASDLRCVHELVVDGPLPAGELARRLHLTSGAITHMVDRLTAAGLVCRVQDRRDRRRVLVEADPVARERLIKRYTMLDEQVRRTLAQFTAAERAVVARFVEASVRDIRALLG
ncbi:MarR family winged helix-turn-helix transcriptional regulator [Pseudonocardia sp. ICBG1142]|uniref:MarR family winged helix-turn-helix transcriptional regulator n=1 Tax=Pseudonocardia sp. ICBG1142 TaxID=2846760 RepID=UPI001CF6990F|nr:MarR family transcriptional regulator [Pseudonocardia sp. ICBG1142]